MIQIKIEISETGVNITVDTPLEKIKFRSPDEQEQIRKESGKIPSLHMHPSVQHAGKKVKAAVKAMEKVDIQLQDPAYKRKSPKFKGKRICPYCDNEFTPAGARQVFCTIEHKKAYNERKKDLDQTIKKAEQLADKLDKKSFEKKSDRGKKAEQLVELVKESEKPDHDDFSLEKNGYFENKSGVAREVQKIADDHPDLTGYRLCKECGGSFKPKSPDQNDFCSDRCAVNFSNRK